MATKLTLYDKDFYLWTEEQVKLIDKNNLDKLDLLHIKEEIKIMGASELRELDSRLTVLLMHLLKWKYQPNLRSRSWNLTIKEQRRAISRHLERMPSLKSRLKDIFNEDYEDAVLKAEKETGFDEDVFPNVCEWDINQVLNEEFFPE